MHILLTDVLACPRCGPDFGLVVLADSLEDRRVREGRLGCANCREHFRVEGGVADLRHPLAGPLSIAAPAVPADDESVYRTAALLGAQPPNASVLVLELSGERAAGVATLLQNAHVVGASTSRPAPDETEPGRLSRVLIGGRAPFRTGSFLAAAVIGAAPSAFLEEVRRVLVPGGRIVLEEATATTADDLRTRGFRVDLQQNRIVVAAAPGAG